MSGVMALVFFLSVTASFPAAEPILIRSQSGQFVIRGLPLGQSAITPAITGSVSYLRLDPPIASVTLERIKSAILRTLQLPDEWRGPVYLALHPAPRHNEPIVVRSVRHLDNWSYHIVMPEQVDKKRFLKTMVQVVLMEMANRGVDDRAAELPPWLATGLAAELQSAAPAPLMAELEVRNGRRPDPLGRARAVLREQVPLRFDQLNFPPPEEELTSAEMELFENCAHLFVHELLDLRNGPNCLADMLQNLSRHWNWQTAFLRSFHDHFPRLVDVDKWWALNVVLLTGRDMFSIWPEEESLRRLSELLHTPVQVRTHRGELPLTTHVTLQSVIEEWEPSRQTALLRHKLHQLEAIRPRLPERIGPLADRYRQIIGTYLDKRPGSRQSPIRETIQRLDELDAQRDSLRDRLAAANPTEDRAKREDEGEIKR
jgi:hypothetical protein